MAWGVQTFALDRSVFSPCCARDDSMTLMSLSRSGFEPETYWDRMQLFQEAILYR